MREAGSASSPSDIQQQRRTRSDEEAQRTQERYNNFIKQRREQQQASDEQADEQARVIKALQAQLNAIPLQGSSEEQIKEFCRDVSNVAELSERAARANLIDSCRHKLSAVQEARAKETEIENSRLALSTALSQIKNMPDNDNTIRELENLKNTNGRNLPSLTYSDRNTYLKEIERKAAQIRKARASEQLASLNREVRAFIERHPEYQPDQNPAEAQQMYTFLYSAEVALEYCVEQTWFSGYKNPLAEVRRREQLLDVVLNLQGLTASKIAEFKSAMATARDQMRYTIKYSPNGPARVCDEVVVTLALGQRW